MARRIKVTQYPEMPPAPVYCVLRYATGERVDFDDLAPGELFTSTPPDVCYREKGQRQQSNADRLADPARRLYDKYIRFKLSRNEWRGWWEEPELNNEIRSVRLLPAQVDLANSTTTYWVYRVELVEVCPPPPDNSQAEAEAMQQALNTFCEDQGLDGIEFR